MKTVVVRAGMLVDALNPEVDTTNMFLDQDVEIYLYDETKEGAVPLWGVNTQMVSLAGIDEPPRPNTILVPLSDPRLRISLEECIQITVTVMKGYCSDLILARYPVYKQLNISMLMGYTQKDLDSMRNWITNVRNKSNEIEVNFNAIKDNSLVLAYNYRTELNAVKG